MKTLADNNLRFALQMLKDAGHIHAQAYDEQGQLLFSKEEGWQQAYVLKSELVLTIRQACHRDSMPTLWSITRTVFFVAVLVEPEILYLLGPLSAHPVSKEEQAETAEKLEVENESLEIAHAYASTVAMCASSFAYLLTGRIYSVDTIYNMNTPFVDMYIPYWITYHMNMEEHKRDTYEQERAWLESIRRGDAVYDQTYLSAAEQKVLAVGKMADSSYKQEEYLYISGIALAARAAIEGGVAPKSSFEFSDSAMQEIAMCKTSEQMRQVYINAIRQLTSQVRRVRADRSSAGLITRCKVYVDEMIYEHITVASIADALQVSPNYLSASFVKSEHMTLTQYIHNKRLDRSRELLRYSRLSISDISEQLMFSSQSHFSRLFKERFDRTPSQYRRLHGWKKAL